MSSAGIPEHLLFLQAECSIYSECACLNSALGLFSVDHLKRPVVMCVEVLSTRAVFFELSLHDEDGPNRVVSSHHRRALNAQIG